MQKLIKDYSLSLEKLSEQQAAQLEESAKDDDDEEEDEDKEKKEEDMTTSVQEQIQETPTISLEEQVDCLKGGGRETGAGKGCPCYRPQV